MFSLSALYDANEELLGADAEITPRAALVKTACEYWEAVAKGIPEWSKVNLPGELNSMEFRQQNISAHAVVLRAIGAIGPDLMKEHPVDWKQQLLLLHGIDWSKKNADWENVCIVANSVVSNRQARVATKAYLKHKLGLRLNDVELRSLPSHLATGGTGTGTDHTAQPN